MAESGHAAAPSGQGETAPAAWYGWVLAGILLLGVALRFIHIGHEVRHVDEQVAVGVLANLDFPSQWDTNWNRGDIQSGFKYDQYNFSSYHYLLYGWKVCVAAFDRSWGDGPGSLRAMNVVLGLLTLWLLADVGRRMAGARAGLATAAAGAVMPLWIEDAHFLRCEAMLAAGVAGILWLSVRPGPVRPRSLFIAAVLVGWLAACKATMVLILPVLLPGLIEAARCQPEPWRKWLGLGSLLTLGLFTGFFAGVPFGVMQPHLYFAGLAQLSFEYGRSMPPYTQPDLSPSIGFAASYLRQTVGLGFGSIMVLGMACLLKRAGWFRTMLWIAPLLLALLLFGSHALFTERSYSPYLCLAVLFFGAGCQFMVELIARPQGPLRRAGGYILAGLLACSLALPVSYAWQLDHQIFSGQEQQEKDEALARMKGSLQGQIVRIFNAGYYEANCRELDEAREKNRPVLIVMSDYYDEDSHACLERLHRNYQVQILGVRESIFRGLPPCMMTTIMSPRLWMLYIPAQ